jgi:hypothetical protein
MREKGVTKVKIKAIDLQIFLAPQKILKMPRAYESLNPGLNGCRLTNKDDYFETFLKQVCTIFKGIWSSIANARA